MALACPDKSQLIAFFSPGLKSAIAVEVETHAAECSACRSALAEYAKMSVESRSSQTRNDEERSDSPPNIPAGPRDDLVDQVELAHRLARANAGKHLGAVLKDKWHIERLLGMGGMAYVFAARHRNGRRVAIKCMRPELAIEPSLVERFLREGYVANKIEHPGAVAILDDDVMEDGSPFLVMEFLTGATLGEHLAKGPLPLGEALRVIGDVLDVLAAAHDKGIVHRDLKPDNIFRTEDGAIKVLDFGIARLKERARPQYETQSGIAMGTVGFMPPEQARGITSEIDARTDVWAIGATLFALLSSRAVHEASTPNEALLLAMTTPVAPMHTMLPWIPAAVQSLLDRALAFQKADRYPTARAMKEDLEAARASLLHNGQLTAPHWRPPSSSPSTELTPAPATATVLERAFARRGQRSQSAFAPRRRVLALVIASVLGVAAAIGVFASATTPATKGEALVATPPSPPDATSSSPIEAPLASANTAADAREQPASVVSASPQKSRWTPASATRAPKAAPSAVAHDPTPASVSPRDPLSVRR